MRARGAAMVEYALFAMAMVAGTAAAKHLVGQRAGGIVDIAAIVMDDAANGADGFGGGDDTNGGGGRRGGGGIDESGGVIGGGGSDGPGIRRDRDRRQGTAPRPMFTFRDDGRSAP